MKLPEKGENVLRDEYHAQNGVIRLTKQSQSHMAAHPEVNDELLAEAIAGITLPTDGPLLKVEVDLGRVIGVRTLVETFKIDPDEPALFAHRNGRGKPTRTVHGDGTPCSTVVVSADRDAVTGDYILYTAHIGKSVPCEPHDPNLSRGSPEFEEALTFWCTHALVWEASMQEPFEATWNNILNDP